MAAETRILIADEHRGARDNLRQLLARIPGFAVVGAAEGAAEALAQVRALAPDLVLLDAGLLGSPGADLLAGLRALPQPPRIVLMTSLDQVMDEAEAHALGAAGAISKLAGRDSLLAAIRRALQTEPDVHPAAASSLPTARIPPDDDTPPPMTRGFALSLGGGTHDLAVATDEAHTWRFREALARWPSGVTVVTTHESDNPASPILGITVSSFCSLSLDPTLVLIAIGEGQPILPALLRGRFTVNILGAEQSVLSEFFARRSEQALQPVFVEDEILAGSRAALVCTLWREYPGGDHRILIGLVERVWLGPPDEPLIFARREYRRLGDAAETAR
ncbi:MAG TPA: flavin reductase [Ktedonobacterales bacterium]|nr:flavin reductase [Ktedonobacterales bacterium]